MATSKFKMRRVRKAARAARNAGKPKRSLPEALKKHQFKKGHKPIPKGQGKPKLKLAQYSPEKKKAALEFFKKMAKKKPAKAGAAPKTRKKRATKVKAKKVLSEKGHKISKGRKRVASLKKAAIKRGTVYKPRKKRADIGKAKGTNQTRALRSMNAM